VKLGESYRLVGGGEKGERRGVDAGKQGERKAGAKKERDMTPSPLPKMLLKDAAPPGMMSQVHQGGVISEERRDARDKKILTTFSGL